MPSIDAADAVAAAAVATAAVAFDNARQLRTRYIWRRVMYRMKYFVWLNRYNRTWHAPGAPGFRENMLRYEQGLAVPL